MQRLALLATLFTAASVSAQPTRMSLHPRVGELCEIDFPAGSDRILATGADDKIGQVAGWAREHPGGLIVLDGFVDAASEGAGQPVDLAMARARAVSAELTRVGVDPADIVLAAYGPGSGQRADADHNRRVTVWVTDVDVDAVVSRLDASGASRVVWNGQQLPVLATP